jgi:hypothetical protein
VTLMSHRQTRQVNWSCRIILWPAHMAHASFLCTYPDDLAEQTEIVEAKD